jgi:signal transduction histidine kinase/DNA-binding response OmpR family regulator
MRKIIATTLILINSCFHLQGSNVDRIKFNHITVENGLNSNTVLCVFQDSEDFMWFGTNDGLTRYDTYELKQYRNNPSDSYSIGNNSIHCISEDKQKNLWIGTEGGIYIYERETDRFIQTELLSLVPDFHVKSIIHDRQDRVWIATLGNGVYCLNRSSSEISYWSHDPNNPLSLASDYSPKILTDALGNIWCLTSGSYLYKYDENNKRFSQILIKDKSTGNTEKNAFSMCLDWEDNIWIGGWDSGLFYYNTKENTFKNYLVNGNKPILNGRIHTINEISPGKLLLGSDEGLTSFDIKTGQHNTASFRAGNGLSDDFVHDIYIDKEGGLWVATYFGGINYSNPNSSIFLHKKCTEFSTKGRVVSKFCEDSDGKIFIGTDDGGLFLYDPSTDICNPVTIDSRISNLNIHALLDDENTLWIGSYSNGLYKKDKLTGQIKHYLYFDGDQSISQSVYSLFKDQTEKLWIGTKTAIWSWSEDNGFRRIIHLGFNSDIIEIQGDNKSNIWFASISKGLLRYDPKTQETVNITTGNDGKEIPKEIQSMCIVQDKIFLGTLGKGLIKYDIATGNTEHVLSSSVNMQNMTIFHIINRENDLWISTNEGLMKYNISSGKINLFKKADGLKSDIFNCNSGIMASDGRIYIGTNDGFNIFNPEEIQTNFTAPNTLFIKSSFANLKNGDHITIHKGHNPFTIRFASLSYWSSQNNKYRYIMEGYDNIWHNLPWNENQVLFSDLKSGTYTFKVCSCNNDGIWGNTISATITVKPYWWNCMAAIIIYILLSIALVAGIVAACITITIQRKNNRAEKIKHVKEKTRIETELQFFTNLAHEIKTPVMLINAPAYEVLAMDNLPEKVLEKIHLITKSSDKLMNLTTEILNFREYSKHMHIQAQRIIQITSQIVEDFRTDVESHGITFKFTNNIEEDVVAYINIKAWNRIISDLITNAIQFTKDLIEIKAEISDDIIRISVHDNGIGIAQNEMNKIFHPFWHYDKYARRPMQGFGLGLPIANMLAHKMGMKIKVDSEPDKFSTFTIYIPLSNGEVIGDQLIDPQCQKDQTSKEQEITNSISLNDQLNNFKPLTNALIIDNDDDFRLYLSSVLSDTFNIISASNGEEGLEILRSGKSADIVICNVMMPKIDGIEFCHRLKNDLNLCHIPIILLSSNTDIDIQTQCIESGADVCISKLVDISYLVKRMRNLLEKRRILWDSFSKRPLAALTGIVEKDSGESFIKHLSDLIIKNMSRQDLTVDILAEEMHKSRSVLFKKVKDITGMTPNNLIKNMRLHKAAEFLAQGNYKINEICWKVGFSTPSYFSKCFYEYFGMYPKDFVSSNRDKITKKEN